MLDPLLRAELGRADRGGGELQASMAYTLFAPAKRFRPALVLAAVRASGGEGPEGLPVMAAVELLHTYSLIHDDLPCMDDDDLRRGQPACHRVYGVGIAMLAGDGLQALAFDVLARAALASPDGGRRELRALSEITRAAGPEGMVAGQALDLRASATAGKDALPDRDAVEDIHRLKTGALLRASVMGGAHVAGADAATISRLEDYSDALGIAFQAADDRLNASGDSRLTGKSVGSDARRGKATLPAAMGHEEAHTRALELAAKCRRAVESLGERGIVLGDLAEYAVTRSR
jgi:geranylgeranyl pyrophosphate synthase